MTSSGCNDEQIIEHTSLSLISPMYAIIDREKFIFLSAEAIEILPDGADKKSVHETLGRPIGRYGQMNGADGRTYEYVSTPFMDVTAVLFFKITNDRINSALLEKLGSAVRSSVSILIAASGLLFQNPIYAENTDPKVRTYISMMYHGQNKLLRIANNLSDFQNLSNGEAGFFPVNLDVNELCRELVGSVRPLLDTNLPPITLSVPSEPLYADVDRVRVEQMLLNLLSNALKYTPPDGEIKLSVSKLGNYVSLSVSDSGPGIPKDKLANVFSNYEEYSDPTDIKAGIGFGLPLVIRLAELHGGTALIDSREGGGTTVRITLPIENNPDGTSVLQGAYPATEGYRLILSELADILDYSLYAPRYLD